ASASPRENLLALCSYLGVLGEICLGATLALREQQRVLDLHFVRDARGVSPFALADTELEPVELARSLQPRAALGRFDRERQPYLHRHLAQRQAPARRQ